ncbi:MAG: hypothetical protein OWQ57_07995, partial [Sulfobacillus sp.]|nr:hypothetical protein [Sulfobacillus sp.]
MTEGLTRRVKFTPGYDRRHPNPSLDGGVHGMEIRFILSGPKGAVTFLLYTDWLPETTAKEYQQTHPAPVRPYQA